MKPKGSIKKILKVSAITLAGVCVLAVAAFGVADAVAYSRVVVEEEKWDYTFWLYEGEKDDAGGTSHAGEVVEIVEKFDPDRAKEVLPGTNFGKVIDLRSNASYESYGYVLLEIETVEAMKAEDMKPKVYDACEPQINSEYWELIYQNVSKTAGTDSRYIYRYKTTLKANESTSDANDRKSLCTLVRIPAFTEVTGAERTLSAKGYLIQTVGFETGTLASPGTADAEAIRILTQ